MLAANNGHYEIVQSLLVTDSDDANAKIKSGWTSLSSAAAANGHSAVVKLLLDTGKVDINSADEYGRTALFWAAANGHCAVIKQLLYTGIADAYMKDNEGLTPLFWAMVKGQRAAIELSEAHRVKFDRCGSQQLKPPCAEQVRGDEWAAAHADTIFISLRLTGNVGHHARD